MKKQLHEVMGWRGPMTARQQRAWELWLNDQLDVPSRTDWYIMQLTAAVCRLKEGTPLSNLKIDFADRTPRKVRPTRTDPHVRRKKQLATALAKQQFMGMMTMPVIMKTITKEEAMLREQQRTQKAPQ